MVWKKYKVDEGFFDVISPDVAYILGYIWGDGGVNRNKGRWERVVICGHKGDSKLLEEMMERMRSTYRVRQQVDHCRVDITSIRMTASLKALGARFNKVAVLGVLGQEDLKSFTRGFIDADGCIYHGAGKVVKVSMRSMDVEFLKGLEERLKEEGGFAKRRVYVDKMGCGDLNYGGASAKKLIKLLEPKSSELSLERKWLPKH